MGIVEEPLEQGEIQGLVGSGFGRQRAADFLLLTIQDVAAARDWLAALLPRLTMCTERTLPIKRCVAFSSAGLSKLGVPAETSEGFSKEFSEGMLAPHRQRILGDLPSSPSDPARWAWGGPNTGPVDAVLMIYAPNRAACDEAVAVERQALRGVAVGRALSSVSLRDRKEHFGFRDGITNPFLAGLQDGGLPEDAVPAGELVLGYPDSSGSRPPGPTIPRAGAGGLPACPTAPERADFGRNGTYLVFRQIEQDVQGFWNNLASSVDAAGLDSAQLVDVAAKMLGRRPDGTPLSTAGSTQTARNGQAPLTFADDPHGLRCPIGAHIRRANPRDGLVENQDQSRQLVNAHRILRRGRAFGKPGPTDWYPPGLGVEPDDALPAGAGDEGRGLFFLCICADISRQFEFLQQTWLNNRKFGGLFDETDPISSALSPEGRFTVPRTPLRVRLSGLQPATRTVGGAYLMLPSRAALGYLAGLR